MNRETLQFTFLGTGDAAGVPCYGCHCAACEIARQHPGFQRHPSCLLLEKGKDRLLIDAGLADLRLRFHPGELDAILLTHYHMDHVAGLFPMRWGPAQPLPVYGPDDKRGCDDLYKHPGCLDFQPPLEPFKPVQIGSWIIEPLPLKHSRPTLGYLVTQGDYHLAYLTDTVGLPPLTRERLQEVAIKDLILDCTHPPQESAPRNHNDWNLVSQIAADLKPQTTWLTHLSHEMDCWLLTRELPANIQIARDRQQIKRQIVEAIPV